MISNIKHVFIFLSLTVCLFSCSKWDEHNALTDASLGKDLLQQINENPNLSKFAELLVKSGYDKVVSSSKTFTVWAPTNAALATLDPAIVADTARLRLFVGNHIATQMYSTGMMTGGGARIALLNGKYNNMTATMFEDATITEANKYVKNGLLHIIDKAIPALNNDWQTLESNAAIPAKQKAYLLSLFQNVFDATNAVQIGVNPLTGQPVYQPGTDSIRTNLFWRNVYDVRTESKQYTLFVLTDAAWDGEIAKFKPYYATSTVDSTTSLTSFDVVKEFAVEGAYPAASLPDTFISRSGVKVPVDKTAIVQTIKTSNGYVHIMNKLAVPLTNKLKEFYIEAENYRGFSNDRRGNTYFRDRIDSLTFKPFRDVLVIGHAVANFWLSYRVNGAYSVKYRAYWRALNDFQPTTHQQKLSIGTFNAVDLPIVTVPLRNFSEVYLGEFTLSRYNPALDVYLVGANSTTQAVNPLVCDYIRLVPVP